MRPETPDMSKPGVPGTSSLKRWLVMSTEPVKMFSVARSQASSDLSQMIHFRTLLREVDMFVFLILDTFSSLTTDAELLCLPSLWQDCFASELSCLVPSKIPPVPASFLVDKALNWYHVDDAAFPALFKRAK